MTQDKGDDTLITGKTVSAEEVIQEERKRIKVEKGDPLLGLGLSGGGIRSAAFNLGLLQALDVGGLMEKMHYLSTVSGGGYIGSAFSWFKACDGGQGFPFARPDAPAADFRRRRVDWIRGRGDYLTPTAGLNGWAFAAAIFRGTIVNLAVLLPVLLGLMIFLAKPDETLLSFAVNTLKLPAGVVYTCWPLSLDRPVVVADQVFLVGALLGMVLVVGGSLLYAFASYKSWSAQTRQEAQKWSGRFLWGVLVLLVLGSLPWAHQMLQKWAEASSAAAMLGAISTAVGWLTREKSNEGRGWRSIAISLGLVVVSYLVLVYGYHLAVPFWWETASQGEWTFFWGTLVVSVVIGLFANINLVSMHRYYRDRLREAFMPAYGEEELGFPTHRDVKNGQQKTSPYDPDKFLLSNLAGTNCVQLPFHLINTTMSTLTSREPKLAGRGGENFVFSSLFCGSQATRFRWTAAFARNEFTLATAFTISGAAVDPNNGITRFGPLAFLMALLNVRLGYWCINPDDRLPRWLLRSSDAKGRQPRSWPWWLIYIGREMFQAGLDEKQHHIRLSDGGHFENLGAYELIRRRCEVIIVGDAGADPGSTFDSLGNLVEKVRVDFGAEVAIDTTPMIPKSKEDKTCRQPYLVGTVRYPAQGEDQEKMGILIYVNTCLFPDLPACVLTYQRMNTAFPEQTTADQFFDEAQFEAYRELGFRAGLRMALDLLDHAENRVTAGENPWEVFAKKLENESQKDRLLERLTWLGKTLHGQRVEVRRYWTGGLPVG